jgi:thiol:disulfide interchange protein DsbA
VHRLTRFIWLGLCLLLLPLASGAAEYAQGRHYVRIDGERRAEPGPGVEVIEVFWYGCPHCYRMEPMVDRWLAAHGDEVSFVRLPAMLNRAWRPHAKAFYTAKALGVAEKMHPVIFDAIHKDGRRLSTKESLADLFANHGVDRAAFNAAWGSFGVDASLRRAEELVASYGLMGVPAFVVNGKYWTDVRRAGGYDEALKVVTHLVNLEKQQQSGQTTGSDPSS